MKIAEYKELIKSFCTKDFGEYDAETFIKGNPYPKPAVYPLTSHPRILFTKDSIENTRQSLDESENEIACERYITLSDTTCDGLFKALSGKATSNYDSDIVATIESKAFRYAMTGDKFYGYAAIYSIKNAILTLDAKNSAHDYCRCYGRLMYVAACVYDWCYDLMTEDDKVQIIAGSVNLLGMNLEVVYRVSETNKLPTAQGSIFSHGAEDQILVNYLAFAIACYDEAPEIYELVAGRIFTEHVPGQNFMLQSGTHWEGSMYGSFRITSLIVSNILFNRMTDGEVTPFENLENVIISSAQWIRPDGQVYRIGDINENKTAYQFLWFAHNCFYAGNLYKNSYLKSVGYKYLKGFTSFNDNVSGLSAVQFLALNDPSVSYTCTACTPLTCTATYPFTSLFAKNVNDDKNAFGIYMTMPDVYMASHCHMECGSFQIFYKGALASDSGAYDNWGSEHNMGYNVQTIASNSLLIYNPNLKDYQHPNRKRMFYSGGQSIPKGVGTSSRLLSVTLSELKEHPGFNWCTSLGVANVEENGKYLYSYMGGDMTNAYDDVTVDEVTRYMLAVSTDNEKCPLAFFTFDRITSKDASYRKFALIHVQEEPTVTNGEFVVITNTRRENHGKMIVQNVAFNTDYTVVGGKGKEFWIPGVDADGKYSLENGRNLPQCKTIIPGSIEEYGWGRVEISPKEPDLTNHMLTVMYVTDAENSDETIKAQDISSDNLAGAMIFGKAVLFPKNEKFLAKKAKFDIKNKAECFICGVASGEWLVYEGETLVDTVTVKDKTNFLAFAAKPGDYKIELAR